jgi:hypothetical protein
MSLIKGDEMAQNGESEMVVKYYYDLVQGSDEWKKARLGILTASQTKGLITPTAKLANNKDSRAIVYEKVAERITGRIEESFSNADMERGNTFEPFARDLYRAKIAPVKEVGFIVRDFGGFKIGYSPDGLVNKDGLIEIKAPGRTKHVKEICQGEEPKEHMMQFQTGMLVTGRKWCDYMAYFNGMKPRIVRVYPDIELQNLIVQAAEILEARIVECIEEYNTNTIDMPIPQFIESETI